EGTPPPVTVTDAGTLGALEPTHDEAPQGAPVHTTASLTPPSPRRTALMVGVWLIVLLLGTYVVLYGLGPLFQQREQHRLIGSYRGAIARASNQSSGLFGVEVPTKAPDPGAPVAILEIGKLSVQQVVVEGVASSQTRAGPGHVAGTAGPGQPGNSVIVGRAHAFGKPLSGLAQLRKGSRILVTTTQGQSVYVVDDVRHVDLSGKTIDETYGRSKDDRLTLITSSSSVPWNGSAAIVAVAKMETVPFVQTPQGGRVSGHSGMDGESGALSSVILCLALYGCVMAGSVFAYRRLSLTSAYLLTIAPAAAVTVIAAETLSRLLPAWT
ncbi:MAG: sortase, partial [Actinomycetota bacterium]|nr:sortase [Actinomycetota bacterium]